MAARRRISVSMDVDVLEGLDGLISREGRPDRSDLVNAILGRFVAASKQQTIPRPMVDSMRFSEAPLAPTPGSGRDALLRSLDQLTLLCEWDGFFSSQLAYREFRCRLGGMLVQYDPDDERSPATMQFLEAVQCRFHPEALGCDSAGEKLLKDDREEARYERALLQAAAVTWWLYDAIRRLEQAGSISGGDAWSLPPTDPKLEGPYQMPGSPPLSGYSPEKKMRLMSWMIHSIRYDPGALARS